MVERRTESLLITLARQWVAEKYAYNRTHLLKSLDWLDRIAPDAAEAVRLATLTHDMERAFGGPDAIPILMNDREYERAHSERSARIVGEWLRANGAAADLVSDVQALIRVHEWGGSAEADLVQAADSLSFLETNIDLMLGLAASGRYTSENIAVKIRAMYDRIRVPSAKQLARPLWEEAERRLSPQPSHRFDYARPTSLDELFRLMRTHGDIHLLAGGTDLLVRARRGFARRDRSPLVIDLKRIPELRADVAPTGRSVRIGARTVITDLVENPTIRAHFPALIDAALVVGSIQIRNRATVVGNICNASPAADTATALLAYGAAVRIVGPEQRRTLPLADFFAGPGRTALGHSEIVEAIDVPLPDQRTGAAFQRLTRRQGVDLAIVSVCCVARESGDVRMACGAVGPRPFVIACREDRAVQEAVTHATPITDLRGSADYRSAILQVLARKALTHALMRLGEAKAVP